MVINFQSAEKQLIQFIKSNLGFENEGFKTLISEALTSAANVSSRYQGLVATRYDVHPSHGVLCDSLDELSSRRYYDIKRDEEANYFSNVLTTMQGNWITKGFDSYTDGTNLCFGDKESCASRVLVGLTLNYLINSKFKRDEDVTSFEVNDNSLLFKGGDHLVVLLTDCNFISSDKAYCHEYWVILHLKKGTFSTGNHRSFTIERFREQEFTYDEPEFELCR
jgi:hypothetical protein